VTAEVASEIYNPLKKPSYQFTDLKQIAYQLAQIKPKPLTEEANRVAFYETFRLREESPGMPTKFTKLVYSLMDLFDELMKEESKSEFLEGAYKFWNKSYAHKPGKVPKSWQNLARFKGKKIDEETLYKFMFCLETAHNIVAKLILAKVCEDMKFWDVRMTTLLSRYLETEFLGEVRINTVAYPFALKSVLEKMRDNLVENVFEEDIFDWWTDCKQIVGESSRDWRRKKSYVVVDFGLALAKVFFALRSFDFYGVKEDILGELYQHYFDPETRKALGEFYTPIEVVDYILGAVDYNGKKILNKRLLDPACGSGTFVVEALKRYLGEAELQEKKGQQDYWAVKLRDLCERPKIIGFDINPFAVLMAQIRFMMELVPYYKRAKEGKSDFILTTIPIFRTDSLEIETKTGMLQRTLDNTISFSMRLPIVEEEEFLSIDFSIPSWEPLKRYLLGDMDNYFILLKLTFDVIKDKARKEHYKVLTKDLADEYQKRFDEAPTLAGFLQPYAQQILDRIEELKEKYKDGRLIKSLEDLVLAGVLKNFFSYDYVVGNPPYVRKELIPPRYKKEILEEGYEVYHGDNDLFVYFMEAGIRWLNENGKFSFITSNKYMKTRYGGKLRKYVVDQTFIEQLVDFGDTKVFADAINYPTIFVFSKSEGKNPAINTVVVNLEKDSDLELMNHIKTNVDKRLYFDKHIGVFRVNQENLTEDIWKLVPEEFYDLMNRIAQDSIKLMEISRIDRGIYTGLNEAFVVNESTIKNNDIERQLLKPLIAGKNVKRFSIDYEGSSLIYTKDIEIEDYPKTKSYLEQFREKLEKRWCVVDARMGRKWYELEKPREPSLYETEKIITPDISLRNNFTFDANNFYCLDTAFVIVPRPRYKDQILSILGILNSKLLEFYFKQISTHVRGGYFRYKKQYLNQLPIHLPKNKAEQKLVDEISSHMKKILSLAKKEQRIENFPDPYFDELLEEIDEWSEVKWTPKRNYKEVKIEVKKDLKGESTLVFGKGDELSDPAIDSEVKMRYVIEALKGKTIKKGVEVVVRLPRSDAIVNKILEEYEEDKRVLLETPISKLEGEINERVYRLYGLDENDIKVIEEFLERF
jgi:type I restriction-modification system DNA methylase subunit